jgi:hypothetical protein
MNIGRLGRGKGLEMRRRMWVRLAAWMGVALMVVMTLAGVCGAQGEGWKDELVERGGGEVMGQAAHHEMEAEWVLNHQFLRLHEKTTADAPKSARMRRFGFWAMTR